MDKVKKRGLKASFFDSLALFTVYCYSTYIFLYF